MRKTASASANLNTYKNVPIQDTSAGIENRFFCFRVYAEVMVLSSQTTNEQTRHLFGTDVAARWGNLADAAATGAEGCNSLLLPNPSVMLGDTETGHGATRATLSFWKYGVGRWERCNISPTGGRQHGREVMSSNGVMLGDDQHAKGAVALGGASSQGRRIAQVSNGNQYGCCGVFRLRSVGASGQNSRDIVRPSRDVDSVDEGKPRVRNICGAKGLRTDCTANRSHMLIGLHFWETRQKIWLTWEAAGYTSNTRFLSGRSAVGAVVSRFKQVERKLFRKPCVLVFGLGRKLPSVIGRTFRSDWVSSARIYGSYAEHQDGMGWPPERQHIEQGDSCSVCGQTCNSSAVFCVKTAHNCEQSSTTTDAFCRTLSAPSWLAEHSAHTACLVGLGVATQFSRPLRYLPSLGRDLEAWSSLTTPSGPYTTVTV